ncbi:16S rRNA (uracil(1498)-N(3))-methyltransferase [Galenea microaerophila]
MRRTRFFLPKPLQAGEVISLDKAQTHYALNVLRLKNEHPVELFDGEGHQAIGTLRVTGRRSADVYIEALENVDRESPLHTILLQGISKGDRMDFTLQKSVELGVTEIQPLFTQRCDVKLSDDKLEKRLQHWQGVIQSACEQCGRNRLPKLYSPMSWQAYHSQTGPLQGLILDPKAAHTFKTLPDHLATHPIHLFIGPEGGLTEEEIQQAQAKGLTPTRLGPRILRTETAGLGILAALQARWGDF